MQTPRTIRLEVSSNCQLRCPSCPMTTGHGDAAVGHGHLRLEDFKRLIDDNPRVREIEISNYGEVLLNPEFLPILQYAHEKRVSLRADNGVNLNFARPEALEGLVRYRLRSLTCSIDGATQATYEHYRVGGVLQKVLDNLAAINEFKNRYRSVYPRMAWQFVAFGHNEHEIEEARNMARQLGMEFRLKLNWDPTYDPVQRRDLVRSIAGSADREEYSREKGVPYMASLCLQLWRQPQINWDGKVLGCARNFWGDFGGNAFRDGLNTVLNSERLQYARQMLLGRVPPRSDIPCTSCDVYLSARGKKNPVISRFGRTKAAISSALFSLRERLQG